jgi:hypothetical protein
MDGHSATNCLKCAATPSRGHISNNVIVPFAFFALLFMVVTYMATTPDQSFIGRHAGGLFIWALSIPEAYCWARLDREAHAHRA